jgi:hypothetical protein
MPERTNIESKPKKQRTVRRSYKSLKIGKTTKKVLGGDLLSSGTFKFFPFLVFIAFLAFVYIANNYYAEAKIRKINGLRKELKEINFEYITTKSKLEDLSKQSKLSKQLVNTGLHESTEPVKTIKAKHNKGGND